VSGEVSFRGDSAEISARSVSGGVRLDGRRLARLSVETVSGPVIYHGGLTADAVVDVETASGDVSLHLPVDVGAELHLETRGAIASDLGPPAQQEGHTQVLDFVHGGGGAVVRLQSGGGVLSLRTGDPPPAAGDPAEPVAPIEPIPPPRPSPQ
jgi:DUF4097 and DUF4098 domain-containing protein YvlB